MHTLDQSQLPFIAPSWFFMLAILSRVHLAGLMPRSIAAFSAGRPNASQPIGKWTS